MNTVYELGYLLVPTLSENEVGEVRSGLEKAIKDAGAKHLSTGDVHFIDLAYEMVKKVKSKNIKFDQAHFGWIKFSAEGETSNVVAKAVKGMDEVLRHIIVKTVEDDSVTDLFVSEEEAVEADVNEGVDMGEEKTEEKTEATPVDTDGDDLTKIEGIGPKIAETLTAAGIATFADLAKADTEKVQETISEVRGSHNAGTWAQQAQLAADGKWDELKALQDELDGGREA